MNSIVNSRYTNGEEAVNNKENETGDKHKFGAEPIKNQMPSKLLKFTVMPKHLQFNPFVYTGYRPQMNSWECFMSLTYLHNETLNILTHGLPLLYALWSLPKLLPWNEMPLPILPYFHAAATVCPWLGSSIYHLFMNHHSGVKTYERLLQWDVAGVWVTQSCVLRYNEKHYCAGKRYRLKYGVLDDPTGHPYTQELLSVYGIVLRYNESVLLLDKIQRTIRGLMIPWVIHIPKNQNL
ncbi:Progestin and adipoQ receptor family member 4 [Araneus ventricosus]|uniref:Progestin and adipoQ receptor family member 4 n=1 Tax=Araneus ventricosus TaxID=182803 RepID=A0A4Y2FYR6_ARAVE|nr:Progestin and adipoQ receptor family member 4 [Araneus ventricosus]